MEIHRFHIQASSLPGSLYFLFPSVWHVRGMFRMRDGRGYLVLLDSVVNITVGIGLKWVKIVWPSYGSARLLKGMIRLQGHGSGKYEPDRNN